MWSLLCRPFQGKNDVPNNDLRPYFVGTHTTVTKRQALGWEFYDRD